MTEFNFTEDCCNYASSYCCPKDLNGSSDDTLDTICKFKYFFFNFHDNQKLNFLIFFLINKGIIFGISIFLFLLICLIACKRVKFQRSLNRSLPNITNSRFNSNCRVRQPNTINRNHENLVLQNGKCQSECDVGFYEDDNLNCQPCKDKNCGLCDNKLT